MKKIAKEIHPEKLEEIEFPCEKKNYFVAIKNFLYFPNMESTNKFSSTKTIIKKKQKVETTKIIHQQTICSTKPSFKKSNNPNSKSIQIDKAPKTSQSYISNSQRFIVCQI